MIYVWTGLTRPSDFAITASRNRCRTAGRLSVPRTGEDGAYMKREEYDDLIEDPRGSSMKPGCRGRRRSERERPARSYRNNLSFVKGGMAMLDYFYAFGRRWNACARNAARFRPSAAC